MHGLFELVKRLVLLGCEGLADAEAMLLELQHHLPEPLEPELVQDLTGPNALLHGLVAGSAVETGRVGGLLDRKGNAAGTTGAFGNRSEGCVHVSLLERTCSCAHRNSMHLCILYSFILILSTTQRLVPVSPP